MRPTKDAHRPSDLTEDRKMKRYVALLITAVASAWVLGDELSYSTNSEDIRLAHMMSPTSITHQGSRMLVPVACTIHYDDCIGRADPYCDDQVANVPVVQKAIAKAACLAQYQKVCRDSHCD
jgi:hypothetical protein